MQAPIYTIMQTCNNYFAITKEKGKFKIKNNKISVKDKYLKTQYIRIENSILNDGVYRIEDIQDNVLDFTQSMENYPLWKQPENATDAYKIGDYISYNNMRYISRINANMYVPGTANRWWETVPGVELETLLTDEEFEGVIYGLAVPRDFITLVNDIVDYENIRLKNVGDPTVVSESFKGYSYTKVTNDKGGIATWKNVFSGQLSNYYKAWDK